MHSTFNLTVLCANSLDPGHKGPEICDEMTGKATYRDNTPVISKSIQTNGYSPHLSAATQKQIVPLPCLLFLSPSLF